MFRLKTLFILGAGSSAEVGLPVGEGLKAAIAKGIDIRFKDGVNQISGDRQIMQAIRDHANLRAATDLTYDANNTNPYLYKAWQLKDALPHALSIDNLLDAHKGDEMAEACGKFGIARSILQAERRSRLFIDDRGAKLDFSALGNTWFAAFVKMLTENVSKCDVEHIFHDVSVINFNYDRCLEHYLFNALRVYYALDEGFAGSLIDRLKVVRPYGGVGRLPWQAPKDGQALSFGAEEYSVLSVSKGIKTFNEQVKDTGKLDSLHEMVRYAEVVVFLGFAFHRQNLELLRPMGSCRAKRVYATALGISSSDCELIRTELVRMLSRGNEMALVEINNQTTCNELFSEYWRGLSAGG